MEWGKPVKRVRWLDRRFFGEGVTGIRGRGGDCLEAQEMNFGDIDEHVIEGVEGVT